MKLIHILNLIKESTEKELFDKKIFINLMIKNCRKISIEYLKKHYKDNIIKFLEQNNEKIFYLCDSSSEHEFDWTIQRNRKTIGKIPESESYIYNVIDFKVYRLYSEDSIDNKIFDMVIIPYPLKKAKKDYTYEYR